MIWIYAQFLRARIICDKIKNFLNSSKWLLCGILSIYRGFRLFGDAPFEVETARKSARKKR